MPSRRFRLVWLVGVYILGGCAATRPIDAPSPPELPSSVSHFACVDSAGPWSIHILRVNLSDPDVLVSSSRPSGGVPGRQPTSAMLERCSGPDVVPVGAVNADFYAGDGYTISSHVIDGEILQTGMESDGWASRFKEEFGIAGTRRVFMERTRFFGSAVFEDGVTYPVAGVNTPPVRTPGITVRTDAGAADTVAFRAGSRSVLAIHAGVLGDTAVALVSAEAWERTVRLSSGRLVLEWDPDSLVIPQSVLESGDTLRLVFGFSGHSGLPGLLVGGLPRLVIDGRLSPALSAGVSGPPAAFAHRRHPRTGVGVMRDSTTLLLITVDGRQEGSVGMSLEEFGNLMLSHGVYQGLNLDGGGSTTMVFDGAVVNSPSDPTGERPVANCIVVLTRTSSRPSHRDEGSTSPGGP